ncbi:ABC transporter permease [Ruminococcaceae bacterium OttesenSCG-928-I18]|nr:ABC transporter permease [Ruminococcaceae bacterium OttesenSCG-928-I18]
MRISDLFRFSTDNLRRRMGRTILTIIGVVVGVCAIVVMVSLGVAVNQATDEMVQNWGDLRTINVSSYGAQPGTPDLDDKMVQNFKQMEHVLAATPMYSADGLSGIVTTGNGNQYANNYPSLIGMNPEAIPVMDYELLAGSYLPETPPAHAADTIEVLAGATAVFEFVDTRKGENHPNRQKYVEFPSYEEAGPNAAPSNLPQYDENNQLLNPDDFFFDILNSTLTYRMNYGTDANGQPQYKDYTLIVTGVVYTHDFSMDMGFVMSVESMKKLEKDYQRLSHTPAENQTGATVIPGSSDGTVQVAGYDTVYVKVDAVENMPEVEKAIMDTGYQISSMSQAREDLQGQVAQSQMMLGGLAAVSLFVAALNIANTMTMAIYERTREIGVMKVLGCRLSNIRTLFLIESGAIGLLGGILGVILSFGISVALNYLPAILAALGITANIDLAALFGLSGMMGISDMKLSVIQPWLVLLALCFATGVGLVSGIAPANRAVRISSLEAIRHE